MYSIGYGTHENGEYLELKINMYFKWQELYWQLKGKSSEIFWIKRLTLLKYCV